MICFVLFLPLKFVICTARDKFSTVLLLVTVFGRNVKINFLIVYKFNLLPEKKLLNIKGLLKIYKALELTSVCTSALAF